MNPAISSHFKSYKLMEIILFAFLLLCLTCTCSFARLNETEQECTRRYGQNVDFPTPVISALRVRYQRPGWNIDVGFRNGTACMIRYSKRVCITDREFRLILDAEGGQNNWHMDGKRFLLDGELWRRNDGAIAVIYRNYALLKAGVLNDATLSSTNLRSRDWEKGYPLF